MASFAEKLNIAAEEGEVILNEPMSGHTTFRIGGPADYFVSPCSVKCLMAVVQLCEESGMPYFILGNGSDLLVSDKGYRGVVIRLFRNMSAIHVEGELIKVEAGALLSAVASSALEHNLTGFEFASGIPGTLGGACFMNAGAYGGEMKDVTEAVTVLDKGVVRSIPVSDMAMGYRTSAVKEKGYIVLSAKLHLAGGSHEAILSKMNDFKARRISKQPLDLPSAGSTFKRPEGYFAGKLIMEAGLSGARAGGAMVSKKHAGFIVNTGEATASDVYALICHVQECVMKTSGIRLEPEVRMLGEF